MITPAPRMIRRILFGATLVGAALSRLNCQLFFPHQGAAVNQAFLGCFEGPITEPAGLGEITIVLEAPPDSDEGSSIIGCMQANEPAIDADMSGSVLGDRTQARFTVMPAGGRPAFVLLVTRRPVEGSASELSLVNETERPFRTAEALPRCAGVVTCADLGLPQNFVPAGGP